MGLKGDIEEAKKDWSKAPWWKRCGYSLSVYIAVSAIASLAETVVKWKGFIHDLLGFYRIWVSSPLRNILATQLSINIPENATNLLIIQVTCFILFYISLTSTQESYINDLKNIKYHYDSNELSGDFFVTYKKYLRTGMLNEVFIIFSASSFIAYILTMVRIFHNRPDISIYVSMCYIAPFFLLPIISVFMFGGKYKKSIIQKYIKEYYAPIIFIIFCIGLLAAINKGFSG